MTPHFSTLAWKIPWTEEPGGLQSMGLQRVEQDWGTNLLTMPKPLYRSQQTGKFFKRWEYHITWLASWGFCMQVKKKVRRRQGTTDWFQIGKGVHQGCILSPWLFNLYAEYIMWNAKVDEAQTGIKIARRNINNLRYADDTCLWQKVKRN